MASDIQNPRVTWANVYVSPSGPCGSAEALTRLFDDEFDAEVAAVYPWKVRLSYGSGELSLRRSYRLRITWKD